VIRLLISYHPTDETLSRNSLMYMRKPNLPIAVNYQLLGTFNAATPLCNSGGGGAWHAAEGGAVRFESQYGISLASLQVRKTAIAYAYRVSRLICMRSISRYLQVYRVISPRIVSYPLEFVSGIVS